MIVGVSGAGGRMGNLVAETIASEPDMDLGPLYDPNHAGVTVAGREISEDPSTMSAADVVVEFTEPDVVMENLATWRSLDLSAVVGTSGFDADRVARLRERWGSGPPNCLVVPNFSIGAVVMMRLAEIAAPQFAAAEIIELHHDRKVDAPSGTAIATAERIVRAADQSRAVESTELIPGARGCRRFRCPRPRCPTPRSRRTPAGDLRRHGRDAHDPPRHQRPYGVHAGRPGRRARRWGSR